MNLLLSYILPLLLATSSLPLLAETTDNATELVAQPMIDSRIKDEIKAEQSRFALLAHAPNYILPLSYSAERNNEPYPEMKPDEELSNIEIKFQLSYKVNLLRDFIYEHGILFVAYTQQSQWQAYSSTLSSPFRETNYEPELVLAFTTDWQLLGFDTKILSLSLNHQSNGQYGDRSRSWNRIIGMIALEKNNLAVAFKPWFRLPEPFDDDDNPDILDYMGHAEIMAFYRYQQHQFGVKLRNNLRADNKGSVQIDWQYPIYDDLNIYLQYFNGYGESLIDYNYHTNSVGIGIALTDWL